MANEQTTAVSERLLYTDVDRLHAESMEWLSEVEFWKLEMEFLYNLLDKQTLQVSSEDRETLDKLINKVSEYKDKRLVRFNEDLRQHEKYLNDLLEAKPGHDDETYVTQHKDIKENVSDMMKEDRELRKEVFELVEKYMK